MKKMHFYNQLTDILRLLASDFDVQKSSMPDFVERSDEIALLYDDVYKMLNILDDLPPKVLEILIQINDDLDDMSNNSDFWNDYSLEFSSEWLNIRKQAKEALNCLGENYLSPNLNFVEWIK